MVESLLKRLGEALRDDGSRRQFLTDVLTWFRRALTALTLLFGFWLAAIACGLRFVGEHNVTTGFLLYLPRSVFLLPLPPLFLITLPFHWRMALAQLVASLAFVWLAMGWQVHKTAPDPGPAPASGTKITLLTYNRGENMKQSLQPFIQQTKPDLIILQDAGGRAAAFKNAKGYEAFPHVAGTGEFTLLSRFPIRSTQLVTVPSARGPAPVAARFELDVSGQPVAVYGVHFLTPRDALSSLARGGFLSGILGFPGSPYAPKRKLHQEWWDDRIRQTDALLAICSHEPLPLLVAGDFNAPAGGAIHRRIASQLTDAHLTAGQGFGFTFPGVTRNPLSLGGPWMRIDYILSGKGWQVLDCITEEERPSQHRALAATLFLPGQHP
jgi:endonuclease/exonuclease/phosphatase (EEP) superfamily protein YafD